jgi:transposase
MPWKECHIMDERLRFVARLLDGEKMAVLCEEFGISRKTGYKIYDRYKDCGVKGLTDRSRRPYRQANQLPVVIEQWIVRLKKEYPTWGAPKIRERLRDRCPDVRCPAISTVHAVLDRHGLVTRRRRRRHRPEGTTLSQPVQPNDLWCADYKGEFMLADRRYCYPLTVTDFASRYLITCEALTTTAELVGDPKHRLDQRGIAHRPRRLVIVRRAREAHQPTSLRDGEAGGPLTTEVGPLLGRGAFLSAPLESPAPAPAGRPVVRVRRFGPRRPGSGQRPLRLIVARAGLVLAEPNANQIACEVMAFRQTIQRLAGQVLLYDLALELGTVTTLRGHGLSLSENPVGSVKFRNPPCPPSGAHSPELSDSGPALTRHEGRPRTIVDVLLVSSRNRPLSQRPRATPPVGGVGP